MPPEAVSGRPASTARPPEGMSGAVVGRRFDFAEADVFELEGGRIVRETIYADGLTLERQLGERFF